MNVEKPKQVIEPHANQTNSFVNQIYFLFCVLRIVAIVITFFRSSIITMEKIRMQVKKQKTKKSFEKLGFLVL